MGIFASSQPSIVFTSDTDQLLRLKRAIIRRFTHRSIHNNRVGTATTPRKWLTTAHRGGKTRYHQVARNEKRKLRRGMKRRKREIGLVNTVKRKVNSDQGGRHKKRVTHQRGRKGIAAEAKGAVRGAGGIDKKGQRDKMVEQTGHGAIDSVEKKLKPNSMERGGKKEAGPMVRTGACNEGAANSRVRNGSIRWQRPQITPRWPRRVVKRREERSRRRRRVQCAPAFI